MRDSWGQYQPRAKSLIQKRDFGTLVSRMKGQTRGGTRERAAPRLEHRVPRARSFSTSSMEHGAWASSLALVSNLSLILINLLCKISIKIETVSGFSQGTENGSSREISKIEGGEGIIAVVKMSLTRPLLASSQKDAPIGLDEVGMTVMLRSKCPLALYWLLLEMGCGDRENASTSGIRTVSVLKAGYLIL